MGPRVTNRGCVCPPLLGAVFCLAALTAFGASSNRASRQSSAQAAAEPSTPKAPPSSAQPNNVVACRALESHTSTEPPVTVVVFHQRDRQDQARFAALLKKIPEGHADLQAPGGKWHAVAVARLKSCFGRGLLFLPAGPEAPRLKQGDTFLLRFPAAAK
jgi:hypothetical protein